jgi:hypothetical protein
MDVNTPICAWRQIFTRRGILDKNVKYTNKYGELHCKRTWSEILRKDIEACIVAVLFVSGIQKQKDKRIVREPGNEKIHDRETISYFVAYTVVTFTVALLSIRIQAPLTTTRVTK